MRRFLCFLAAVVLCLYFIAPLLLYRAPVPAPAGMPTATPRPTASPAPVTAGESTAYRAVWVSYLEWQELDFSSADAFGGAVRTMFANIAAAGGTVVIAQVRPFGDALYQSKFYPYSHLCTGTQGENPGFDPLEIMLEAAHTQGLQLEAWVNPYRIQAGGMPAALCAESPAVQHPDWVKQVQNGLYLNPALPAVRAYIADAVAELCENYALDGIHFDDYFYPATAPEFDAAEYAAAGTALALADWRRQNVNELVALCWQTAHRYGVRFGIAPLGEPDLNYEVQYSDTALWLAQTGYVDYLMPQLYWGLDYTKNGNAAKSLGSLAAAWATLPRADGVQLYAGLGAYRIGEGDGSDTGTEWRSGSALAGQVQALAAQGIAGVGLYRYDFLWNNTDWPQLAEAEREALAAVW